MEEAPLGLVPLEGRGSLPFALVHGESLVAAASWALTSAEVELFDYDVPLAALQASGRMLVVHDPLCPLTPWEFLAQAVTLAEETGAVVVGVQGVTDTVKEYDGRQLGATLDRADLIGITSPVVLPASVVGALTALEFSDLAVLVDALRTRFPVTFVEAPAAGRRVGSTDDISVLEALSAG
jgi:2-C-methyl-D-erythritol 4-phosphate cytidylyltransferase